MKKFKIFLLLSILLCFGFTLSSEVQAQGDGPKIFEVGDVLPATEKLRISWVKDIRFSDDEEYHILTKDNNNNNIILFYAGDWQVYYYNGSELVDIYDNDFYEPYTNYDGNHAYVDIDTSSWGESERTVYQVFYTSEDFSDLLVWEVVPDTNDPKKFEIGDVLPAGNIKISWDFTGYPMAVDGDFLISSDGDFSIRIWEFGNITLFINDEMFYADTPGYTIITLTETVTITDMDGYDDYYEYIHGALFWEVISQDYLNGFMEARELYGFEIGGFWVSGEQAWNNGYDLGSELAWDEGFEYGMEIYGYYDPNTNRWLSVSEYLDLYGTDKPGQSDFYGNFDKYFIPALIIVFGGAIVLTILKVFKGRE